MGGPASELAVPTSSIGTAIASANAFSYTQILSGALLECLRYPNRRAIERRVRTCLSLPSKLQGTAGASKLMRFRCLIEQRDITYRESHRPEKRGRHLCQSVGDTYVLAPQRRLSKYPERRYSRLISDYITSQRRIIGAGAGWRLSPNGRERYNGEIN